MTGHIQYWPAALPNPTVSYSQKTATGRTTSDFDVAPSERIHNKNLRHTATLSFTFSEREYHVFRAWYYHRLHDGADWFDMDWLKSGRCQFTGDYKATANQGSYSVTSSAELDYALS